LLAALPYNILIQLMLVLRIANLLLEYAALIRLRYSLPDYPREFKVPGGKIGAWLLPSTTFVVCVAMLALGTWQVVVAGVGFNIAIVILFFVFRLVRKGRHKIASRARQKEAEKQPNISIENGINGDYVENGGSVSSINNDKSSSDSNGSEKGFKSGTFTMGRDLSTGLSEGEIAVKYLQDIKGNNNRYDDKDKKHG